MLKKIGQYQLLDELGSGGMGVVYRAVDTVLQREVALKRLRSEFAVSTAVLDRFRNEAKLQGRLNHPNIAQLYALVQTPEAFCIVMEYVRGAVVQELIPLPPDKAVAVMLQVLAGLECAHSHGVLHRDMKPENILIDSTGSVKVMDFGIAYAVGTERMTREKSLIGTMEYMSPERILGQEVTARSDIYALGIVLFEMLAGRLPFDAMSEYDMLRWHVEQVPRPVTDFIAAPELIAQVIARALRKDPEQRYATCSEMAADLQVLLPAGKTPQTLLAPLILSRVETAGVFDSQACFGKVWDACGRDELMAAEKILRSAANRYAAETGLRRYQATVSRAVFVLDQQPSQEHAKAIRGLLRALAAEKAGDTVSARRECDVLREQFQSTDLGALV